MLNQQIVFFITLLIISIPCFSAELKIGFVDTSKVMKDAPQANAARKKLRSLFSPREKKIVNNQKKLKKLEESLTSKSSFMSAGEKTKIERDIFTLKRDIKREKREFNEDLNIRRNEELSKLQKLVFGAIVSYAKKQNYDAILGESVLFANKRVDVTQSVIKMLQNQYAQANTKLSTEQKAK